MGNERTRSTRSADSRADDGSIIDARSTIGSESDDETRFEAGRARLRECPGGDKMTTAPEMAIAKIEELSSRYLECVSQNWPPHLAGVIDEIDAITGDIYIREDWHKTGERTTWHEFKIEIPSGNDGGYELTIAGNLLHGELTQCDFRLAYDNLGEEIKISLSTSQRRAVYTFVKALVTNWNWGIK